MCCCANGPLVSEMSCQHKPQKAPHIPTDAHVAYSQLKAVFVHASSQANLLQQVTPNVLLR